MSDQVQSFVAAASAAAEDAPKPNPADATVPFVSALQLTGEQEKKMLDHAFRRLQEISSESARDLVMNPTWWANSNVPAPAVSAFQAAAQGLLPADTFLGKRTRYDAMFANDVSWRPFTMGVQNIFQQSNLVVPLSRRICRQMVARAKNHFFGTDPWLAVDPAPHPSSVEAQEADSNFADRVEDFVLFKFNEANSREDKERAIERAMILGECAVKTSYVVRDQIFDVEATVLVDVEANAIKAQDGNYITDQDQWMEKEAEMEQEPSEPQGIMSRIGGAIKSAVQMMTPTVEVLKRDGQTPKPSAPIWQKMKINRRQVFFEGAKSEPIYYKDFLCPITAKDVQTADCVIHLYDKPVMSFIDLLVKRGMVQGDADARMATVGKIAAMVQAVASNNSEPKAGADQQLRPNENFTPNSPNSDTMPVAEFAEFYMWYDANGDGIAENIMLIADRRTKVPIFYDHVANVTTDGLRPIEIVRVNKVEGRWYGVGVMELFESYQTIVDLMVNRWNFSQSRAGRVDFWNPTDTLEGDRDPNLQLNWGATYTKKPGKKMDDILEVKYLMDIKFEQIQTMMQFFMQLAMNESGVTNANDNYVAGMEQAKLATGLVQIQQSGDEMFKPIVAELRTPLERLLKREIEVLLANMNPEEVFEVLEGDTMGLETITAEEVKDIRYKVRFLLTTTKNQQTLQTASAASQLIERFYMLPPEIQIRVASFYRKQLRALDPETDVDAIIEPGVSMAPPPGSEKPGAKGKDGNKSALGVTPAAPTPPQIQA